MLKGSLIKQADPSINRKLDVLEAALVTIVVVPIFSNKFTYYTTPVACIVTASLFVVLIASLFDSIENLDAVA